MPRIEDTAKDELERLEGEFAELAQRDAQPATPAPIGAHDPAAPVQAQPLPANPNQPLQVQPLAGNIDVMNTPGAMDQFAAYQQGQVPGYQLLTPATPPSIRQQVAADAQQGRTPPLQQPAPPASAAVDPARLQRAQQQLDAARRIGETEGAYIARLEAAGFPPDAIADGLANQPAAPQSRSPEAVRNAAIEARRSRIATANQRRESLNRERGLSEGDRQYLGPLPEPAEAKESAHQRRLRLVEAINQRRRDFNRARAWGGRGWGEPGYQPPLPPPAPPDETASEQQRRVYRHTKARRSQYNLQRGLQPGDPGYQYPPRSPLPEDPEARREAVNDRLRARSRAREWNRMIRQETGMYIPRAAPPLDPNSGRPMVRDPASGGWRPAGSGEASSSGPILSEEQRRMAAGPSEQPIEVGDPSSIEAEARIDGQIYRDAGGSHHRWDERADTFTPVEWDPESREFEPRIDAQDEAAVEFNHQLVERELEDGRIEPEVAGMLLDGAGHVTPNQMRMFIQRYADRERRDTYPSTNELRQLYEQPWLFEGEAAEQWDAATPAERDQIFGEWMEEAWRRWEHEQRLRDRLIRERRGQHSAGEAATAPARPTLSPERARGSQQPAGASLFGDRDQTGYTLVSDDGETFTTTAADVREAARQAGVPVADMAAHIERAYGRMPRELAAQLGLE